MIQVYYEQFLLSPWWSITWIDWTNSSSPRPYGQGTSYIFWNHGVLSSRVWVKLFLGLIMISTTQAPKRLSQAFCFRWGFKKRLILSCGFLGQYSKGRHLKKFTDWKQRFCRSNRLPIWKIHNHEARQNISQCTRNGYLANDNLHR